MFWLYVGAILVLLAIFMFAMASDDHRKHDPSGCWLSGVMLCTLSLVAFYRYGNDQYVAGATAHAAGKVTATRIDHGDTVEWKIEPVKEPQP